MQIAIIAGGYATRLGDITRKIPKSMVKIVGRPFIEYQIDFLRENGVEDIVLCIGHLGKQIEDHCGDGRRFGVNIKYSYEMTPLDTAGAIKQAEPLLENIFFTLYGDSNIFLNFQDMHDRFQRQDKLAMMSVYKNDNRYDKSNTLVENGMVVRYGKNIPDNFACIDYGVNIFRKSVLRMIPGSQRYSLGVLFQKLIAENELLAYEVNQRFYEIGSVDGLKEFTEYVGNKK
jgi:N-acetyl-alpha-D-muramate 1-phosphate uridylyltransferase